MMILHLPIGFDLPKTYWLHRIIRILACLILACCLASCSFQPLTVQTQYLSHEDLASYHISTPDPSLDSPTIGERLLIQWHLSNCDIDGDQPELFLKVRFMNHEEQAIQIPIEKQRSYYLYELLNQDYCDTGGILTYLAEIRKGDCLIASWKHPLWTSLITFDSPAINRSVNNVKNQ